MKYILAIRRENTDSTKSYFKHPAHGQPEAFRPKLSPEGPDCTQEFPDSITLGTAQSGAHAPHANGRRLSYKLTQTPLEQPAAMPRARLPIPPDLEIWPLTFRGQICQLTYFIASNNKCYYQQEIVDCNRESRPLYNLIPCCPWKKWGRWACAVMLSTKRDNGAQFNKKFHEIIPGIQRNPAR